MQATGNVLVLRVVTSYQGCLNQLGNDIQFRILMVLHSRLCNNQLTWDP